MRTALGERLARGPAGAGPEELLPAGLTVDGLLGGPPGALAAALAGPGDGPLPAGAGPLVPVAGQEVWAAGVTFWRSREARMEEAEAAAPDVYDRVYEAERPELFLKAAPGRSRGPGEPVGIRADSGWDVPEPELAVVADRRGEVVAYTIGNDLSSRSIEGENPLYLPQAKVYLGSCALGPALVPVAEAPAFEELEIHLAVRRDGGEAFAGSVALADMRRSPAELVDWLFRAQEFPVGAVLLTGTAIVPPSDFTLRPGDLVTITVAGLGELSNPVELVPT
ncbi:MAG TPA: fumarylacetoacetate hydrolase family protein [Actinomycetes bacterium]